MRKLSFAMLALLLSASCAKKKETEKEEPKVSAEDSEKQKNEDKAQAAQQKEQQIEALAKDLQTKEDFEEAAEKEITEENLEAELAKLEAELDPGGEDTAAAAPGEAAGKSNSRAKAAPAKTSDSVE